MRHDRIAPGRGGSEKRVISKSYDKDLIGDAKVYGIVSDPGGVQLKGLCMDWEGLEVHGSKALKSHCEACEDVVCVCRR
jgi:hypothetical protein